MNSTSLLPGMKHFVKSSEKILSNSAPISKPKLIPRATLESGLKIKQFYVKVVEDDTLKIQKNIQIRDKITKKCKRKTLTSQFNINLFFKAVENCVLDDVQAMLEQNPAVVNCQDQFGWTPLMTACCAGNPAMVHHLLQWSPDVNIRDKRGSNCRDLASIRGHQYIVDILDQYKKNLRKPIVKNKQETSVNKSTEPNSFYCEACKQHVENTTYKKHLSSTVHNFHLSTACRIGTMYGIPESNKGFQILVKSGWDKEGGLGPSGEGNKYPPKTILKQDRTGLGAKKYKARVTHTLSETKQKPKEITKTKRNIKLEHSKERIRERNIRRLLC